MNDLVKLLEHRQLIWHGKDKILANRNLSSTGYELLDKELGGGFVKSGVIELLSNVGIGELRLLLPSLLSSKQMLVFIGPPAEVNAQMLSLLGLDMSRLIIINPNNHNHALWAAELCLKSGCCSAVLFWPTDELEIYHIQRLKIACDKGGARQFILRAQRMESLPLPVDLRLSLRPSSLGLYVRVEKRKRGWPSGEFVINMSQLWPWLVVHDYSSNVIKFPNTKIG